MIQISIINLIKYHFIRVNVFSLLIVDKSETRKFPVIFSVEPSNVKLDSDCMADVRSVNTESDVSDVLFHHLKQTN